MICYVCLDDEPIDPPETYKPFIVTTCGDHALYRDCLEDAVEMACKDESLYPIRCCSAGTLPFNRIQHAFSHQPKRSEHLLARYREKREEYETSPEIRVYCSSKACYAV